MTTSLFVVGVSYRSAPLAVREKLAFPGDQLEAALRELQGEPCLEEVLLISTCNRVEIYAVTRLAAETAAAEIRRFLSTSRGVPAETLAKHLYERTGEDAVRHIFRVASSLDSLVVGESQILGQLKDAYGAASKAGCTGPLLGRCIERAFAVAKRVRTETAIARGGANVSSVAVELAKRIFGSLAGKRVLVVGAGKMSDLAARHLHADGAAELLVTNRSLEKAEELARRVEGKARPWDELERLLVAADVVISSTGSSVPIITAPLMRSVMKARRHRPVFLVDIAVPRDVETAVGKLDGVYLFDIDDLEKVVADNLRERRGEAGRAEKIVDAEVAVFAGWLRSQAVVPTIKGLRERFQQIARAEVDRTLASAGAELGPRGAEAVRRLADSIVNKLLHTPLTALKQPDGADPEALAEATRQLFGLEVEGRAASAGASASSGAGASVPAVAAASGAAPAAAASIPAVQEKR